ncbi:DNA-processing protein DprA [Pseudoclavibacter sp. VKM Ac-2888]|uniref:DNA-processing protein DprA n=1 Tax=Pseudoclavibacter sp. VKM Ac-2888 TaxID=2783830 RepID=UPI00188DA288|nr:DNA-processing protein DprA [Pseudoclavibacter sp. VKM Ac-2888]MBF4551777.1 DNA-protecting protein DprA [Pseudoclavibacter sp. VKM Ac-2888]
MSAQEPQSGAHDRGTDHVRRADGQARESWPDPAALRDALAGVSGGKVDDLGDAAVQARIAQLAWSCTVEPGDATAGLLIGALGPVEALEAVVSGALLRRARERGSGAGIPFDELATAVERWHHRLDLERTAAILRSSARLGVRAVLPGDREWPTQLADLGPHAPCALWVRGSLDTLRQLTRSVALVGARASTSYGEEVTVRLASGLASRGFGLVSGGAYGIDAVAHRVALAEGAPTVAVLAGGPDRLYPQGNRSLLERIIAHGALVSELPIGQAPTRWRFLQRNRIISALASATVVVEAGRRSGAANTAAHALTLGRPLGAVPGPVTSAASVGCHRLLRESDASLITSVDDIVELLGDHRGGELELPDGAAWPGERGRERADGDRPSSNAVRARDALRVGRPQRSAEIASAAGLTVAETAAGLAELELNGLAREGAAGWTKTTQARR